MDLLLKFGIGANSSTFRLPRFATPHFEPGVFKTGNFKMGKFKTEFAENLGQYVCMYSLANQSHLCTVDFLSIGIASLDSTMNPYF